MRLPGKVHAVGGGINVDAAGIRPGSKEGRRILFVGRNFVRKGGPLVVQAFTILRKKYLWSAELYLAGAKESDIRDALRERQISRRGGLAEDPPVGRSGV